MNKNIYYYVVCRLVCFYVLYCHVFFIFCVIFCLLCVLLFCIFEQFTIFLFINYLLYILIYQYSISVQPFYLLLIESIFMLCCCCYSFFLKMWIILRFLFLFLQKGKNTKYILCGLFVVLLVL